MVIMADRSTPSFLEVMVILALFLALGAPLAYFLWRELSELLYGRVNEIHLMILVVALVLFFVVLKALSRYVRRLV